MKFSVKQFIAFFTVVVSVVVGLLLIQHSVATIQAKKYNIKLEKYSVPEQNIIKIDVTKIDSDRDGLTDIQEYRFGTHPYIADTDKDGYTDATEVRFGYDPTGAGRPDLSIHIGKINISAPITYPKSRYEQDIQDAMDEGVAYYPGTAFPGQVGNAYLTGHSSNYFWSKGRFNRVFRELRQLEIGDTFSIVQTQSTGHKVNYRYRIYEKRVAENDDSSLFYADREGSLVTLVTSWPIGSTKQRLMLRGELIKE